VNRPVIRRARPEDCEVLSAIAFAAKAHWGYPRRWLEEWAGALTIQESDLELLLVLVAVPPPGSAPIGFAAVDLAPAGEAVLEHLWVHPDWMGQGWGRRLIEEAMTAARGAGRKALLIESDPNAVGFYRQMGAVAVGSVAAPVGGTNRSLPVLRVDLTER